MCMLTKPSHRVLGEGPRLVLLVRNEVIDVHAVRLHRAQVSLHCNTKQTTILIIIIIIFFSFFHVATKSKQSTL